MRALIRTTSLAMMVLQAGFALAAAPIQDMSDKPGAPAAASTAPAAPGQAAPVPAPLTLEQRVGKLERSMDSQAVLHLLNRVEALQQEVQQLRGDLEVATHELDAMKTRQRELYTDFDQRLKDLSSRPAPAAQAPEPEPAAAPAASVPPAGDDAQRYQDAFRLFKEGKYEEAIAGLRAYLEANPQGAYADNAQYWLAEAYHSMGRHKEALQEFNKVITNYPTSPKLPDAALKVGLAYYELADWARARKQLEQVAASHPNTTVAKLARARLDIMKTQGH